MKTSHTIWLLVIVVVAIFGTLFVVKGPLSTTGVPTVTPSTANQVQALNEQTLSFSAVEKFNPTTAVPGTYTYYENGIKSADTDGSFAAKRNIKYDMIVNSSGYVAEVYSFTGSADPMTAKKFELGKLMNLASAITVYNKDSSTNGVSAPYAIATGESKNIELEISGVSKQVYPGGVIVFEANSSAIQEVAFSLGTKTATPNQYTASSTGVKSWAYTFPAVSGAELKSGLVIVTAKDGVNPSNTSNIAYTIYDAQSFVDSKTDVISGPAVEDSDDQDVGAAATTGTIYIS